MEQLRKHLREGESLLWQSGPKQFPLLEGGMKGKILGEWIVTVFLAAWLLYVERDNAGFGTGAKFLVVVVAGAILLSPIVEYFSLRSQRYFLTDQRAILLTGDKTLYYMDFDRMDRAEVIDGVAADRCIAMGGCIPGDVKRQLRWQACHPKTDLQEADTRGEALGMVFYLPDGFEQAVALMRDAGVKLTA